MQRAHIVELELDNSTKIRRTDVTRHRDPATLHEHSKARNGPSDRPVHNVPASNARLTMHLARAIIKIENLFDSTEGTSSSLRALAAPFCGSVRMNVEYR
jgi:hypothetical protein